MSSVAFDTVSLLEPTPRTHLRPLPSVAAPFEQKIVPTLRPFPHPSRPIDRAPSRTLQLPPGDCAYWRAPADCEWALQYLGWGARNYGVAPIAETRHEGWVYALVEAGNPTLLHDGKCQRIESPSLVIIGPDCAFGWRDQARGTSRLLVWMWRQPVHAAFGELRRNALVRYALTPGELESLRRLHAATRMEAHRNDAHSPAALWALQSLLETRLVRMTEGWHENARQELGERALSWVESHLATRQPLARLADFLAVSPATVQRLFRESFGTTVMKKIAELRQREAERLLATEGTTVKEVAYRLGYRHPHDFSRAFRKSSGRLPSQLEPPLA